MNNEHLELDFLPQLPKSNLDDRKFQDLVDECILRIPRYCPEWTNYNPSDPGITLIELFSWLTEEMLIRFNQVPRRNYVAFLELLGIRLQPPVPAKTEVTFYLSTVLPEAYTIPAGTEVATVRTETNESIVFSTDRSLVIGKPRLRYFLTADRPEETPQNLRDRFTDLWTMQSDGRWEGPEQNLFNPNPEAGNSFYLVFDSEQSIAGNVLSLTLRGEAATSTGINPDLPPRRWEAWNGSDWQPILLREVDDETRGFSFSDLPDQEANPVRIADVVFHLPQSWPVTSFSTYRGCWIRCVCTPPLPGQPSYSASPRLVSMAVQSIGGTIGANQSTLIRDELLGISNGEAGQTFQLFETPVLPRRQEEYVLVTPPGGLPQIWQEVTDFADSTSQDRHYLIDSLSGMVQFGPLIREPTQLKQQTQERARNQLESLSTGQDSGNAQSVRERLGMALERQYGAVPPRGAEIRMVAYRTGGGEQGNVQRETITIVRSAVPYVANVINHVSALNGSNAESLEQAAIRVPQYLRTRDRAITAEDYEILALRAGGGSVARARCLPADITNEAGTVSLLVVPQTNTDTIATGVGIAPERLALAPQLQTQLLKYLEERSLIGIQVKLDEPEYVGATVRVEVGLAPEYNDIRAQQTILNELQIALYRFLNPLIGGPDGDGWPFGRPVYSSDIVALFQQIAGVRYLGAVQLFELRRQEQGWQRFLPPDNIINPGPFGLVCSWANNQLRSGHTISLIS